MLAPRLSQRFHSQIFRPISWPRGVRVPPKSNAFNSPFLSLSTSSTSSCRHPISNLSFKIHSYPFSRITQRQKLKSLFFDASIGRFQSFHQSSSSHHQEKSKPEPKPETETSQQDRVRSTGFTALAIIIGILGLSYAAVPLYRMFCRATGYGGTTQQSLGGTVKDLEEMRKEDSRLLDTNITVHFHTNVASQLPWEFRPLQSSVTLKPGEKVLAFFNATNLSDKPIIGVATYNVFPPQSGIYFTKVQCFCFDEQRVNGNESVDMPVYFYVEPAIVKDKRLRNLTDITLSYTFWRAYDDVDEDDEDDEKEKYGALTPEAEEALRGASFKLHQKTLLKNKK